MASAALATMMVPAAAFAANGSSSTGNDTVAVTLTPNETYTATASTPYKDGAIDQSSLGIDTSIASVTSFSSSAATSNTPAATLTSGSSYKLQDQRLTNDYFKSEDRYLTSTILTGEKVNTELLDFCKESSVDNAVPFTVEGSDEAGWSIKAQVENGQYLSNPLSKVADEYSWKKGSYCNVGSAAFTDDANSSSFAIKAAPGQSGAYTIAPKDGDFANYYLASYGGKLMALFQENGGSRDSGGWWNFYETSYNTSMTITAQAAGSTSFALGGKTYNITVADANAVEDVYVGEGQSATIASGIDSGSNKLEGTLSASNDGAEVAASSKLDVAATASSAIESGKSYLVKDLRPTSQYFNTDDRWLTSTIKENYPVNGTKYNWIVESSQSKAALFTLQGNVDSSAWSMQAENGRYLSSALGNAKASTNGTNYSACDAAFTDSASDSAFAIDSPDNNTEFRISAKSDGVSYYLNSYGGQLQAAFLNRDDSAVGGGRWSFYPASYKTTLTATGKTAGKTTEVKVCNTTYRIHTIPTVHVPLSASAKIGVSGNTAQVTGDAAAYVTAALNNGAVILSNNGANVPAVGETKTGYLEVDGQKACVVEISLDGEYSIAQGGSVELTNTAGDVVSSDGTGSVAKVETVKGIADLVTDASSIKSGKQYIIAGARIGRAMTGEATDWSASKAAQGLKHNGAELSYSDANKTRLITGSLSGARMTFVDAGNGKFKIQTADGKWLKSDDYLKLGLADAEDEAAAFSVDKFTGADASKYAGSFQLGDANLCISDWGGNAATSKGLTLNYANPGAALYIYEVKDVAATVTGIAQGGPVYINVGNKSYRITVGAAVASIDGKSYTTIEAAAKAAKAGDTIVVNDTAANESVAIPADVAVKYGDDTFGPVAYKVNDNLTVKTKRIGNDSYLFLPSSVKSIDQGAFGLEGNTTLSVTGNVQVGSDVNAILTCIPREGLTLTKSFKVMLSDNVKTLALNDLGCDISWLNESKNNYASKGSAALIDADGATKTADISKLKGRGNTSWSADTDKKPYNLTLAKKQKLNLAGDGCSEERKWSLIANNTGDYTGVCNDLAYELYQKINGDAAVHCAPVNLYVDGEYRGVYLAVDKVELGKKRVNVTEPSYSSEGSSTQRVICEDYSNHFTDNEQLKDNAQWKNAMSGNPTVTGKKGDSADPAINAGILAYSYVKDSKLEDGKDGGILIEVAHQYTDENCWFVTNHGVMISLKEPDCATQAQVQRIAMYVQDFEDVLYSKTGLNSKGKSVADYADLDSIAKTFILSAFTGQNDFLDCSDYFYVDFDGNGEATSKMHAGPAWDYNSLAMGEKTLYQHKTNQTGYNGRQVWIEQLLKNGDFTAALYKLQSGEFASAISGATQIAADYNNFVANSIAMDEVVWKYGVKQNTWANSFAQSIGTQVNTWNDIWSDNTGALRGVTLASENGQLVATATSAASYEWYKVDASDPTKGTKIDGATSATYTPTEAGIYYVVASGSALSGTEASTMRSNPVAFATVKVTFDGNGQSIDTASQNIAYQGKVTKPADPNVAGYTFGGWFKDAACTKAWDFDTDKVTGDMTLYAKWTRNSTGGGTYVPTPTPKPDPTPTPDPDQPDTPQAPAKGDVVTTGVGTGQLHFKVTTVAGASGKGGTVSLAGCNGSATSVHVPATVEVGGATYAVTEIAPYAFKGAKQLKKVTMAPTITKIGRNAFEGCKGLKSVTIGTGVKAIGKNAFKGCKALTSVTVTSKKLSKKSVAGCLKGSPVKTVVVKVGAPKANKSYAKKYAKVFTKKVCGKKVAVKASKKALKK